MGTEQGRNTRSEKRRIRRKRSKRRHQSAPSAKPAGIPGLVSDHTTPSHSPQSQSSDSGKSRTNSLEQRNLPAYIVAGSSKMPKVRCSGKMPKRPVSERHQHQGNRRYRRANYRPKPGQTVSRPSLPRASAGGRQSLPLDGYGLNLNLYEEEFEMRPNSMQNKERSVSERPNSPTVIDVCSGRSRSQSPTPSAIELKDCNSDARTSEIMGNLSGQAEVTAQLIMRQAVIVPSPQQPQFQPMRKRSRKQKQEVDFDIAQELEGLGSQVDMLGVALHKAKTESKHYQQMLHMVKNDMGMLLQRSYHMLQQSRMETQTYKTQLLELRKQWAREKNLAKSAQARRS